MYWTMANKKFCQSVLEESTKNIVVCDAVAAAFIPISIFNIGILFALCLCLMTITVSAFQLNNWHFRMSNLLLFLSGIYLMCMTVIWYFIADEMDSKTGVNNAYGRNFAGSGDILLQLCGLVELICFCISRWFTIQMYDAKFLENLIADSDDEEEKSQTNSLIDSVN